MSEAAFSGRSVLEPFAEQVRRRVAIIAPVVLFPGEGELRALAEGASRVLRGEDPARPYLPAGSPPREG